MATGRARAGGAALGLCVSCALAASAQHPIHLVQGQTVGEGYGSSVSGGADVDGDGRPDFAVGAPRADLGDELEVGRAELRSGIDGGFLHSFPGLAAGDHFGDAVALVGDVDGDGLSDLVVGASQAGATTGPAPGYVQMIHSSTWRPLGSVSSGVDGDGFGWRVAPAGDVDGDGSPDVIVGTASLNAGVSGYAAVLSGASGAVIHRLPASSLVDIREVSVAGIGDWDADGLPDLAVGNQEQEIGRARVFSGADAAELGNWSYGKCPIPSCLGEDPHLGWAVAGPGDVDGNGYADVLFSAPNYGMIDGYAPAGWVEVHGGPLGGTLAKVHGSEGFDSFGTSVAGVGDVDGDGLPDFAVGAPASHPIGWTMASVRLFSGSTGEELLEVRTGWVGSNPFGSAVAGAGDVDGDGRPDFVAGNQAGPPGTGTGAVLVYSSAPLALESDVDYVSEHHGGTQTFTLSAGVAQGGQLYLLLGSKSGTWPGTPVDGLLLPLNIDDYFDYTLANPNQGPLGSTLGYLDAAGTASATFTLPPDLNPALKGTMLCHAFVVLDTSGAPGVSLVRFASNAVPLLIN